MAVAHILKQKGSAVISVELSQTLQEIAEILGKNRIGAVLVLGKSGAIEGIVSERDVVRAIASDGTKALTRPAREVMTKAVLTCTPRDTEAELMGLMTVNRIRHLPVVEGGKLAGMISIGDVVKFRIESIEREAEEMKSYIASAG